RLPCHHRSNSRKHGAAIPSSPERAPVTYHTILPGARLRSLRRSSRTVPSLPRDSPPAVEYRADSVPSADRCYWTIALKSCVQELTSIRVGDIGVTMAAWPGSTSNRRDAVTPHLESGRCDASCMRLRTEVW